jgi:hypothetical protein
MIFKLCVVLLVTVLYDAAQAKTAINVKIYGIISIAASL